MRRIGLLGGMSWESTAVYYRLLNEGARARRGGLYSADLGDRLAMDTMHRIGPRVAEAAGVPLVPIVDAAGLEVVHGTRSCLSHLRGTGRNPATGASRTGPNQPNVTKGLNSGEAEPRAAAVVLGCTEIDLLIDSSDVDIPLLDSTALHVEALLTAAMASAEGEQ